MPIEYLKEMENFKVVFHNPDLTIPPDLGDPILAEAIFSTVLRNVRTGPDTTYDISFKLYRPNKVRYYPQSKQNDWIYIENANNDSEKGWLFVKDNLVVFNDIKDYVDALITITIPVKVAEEHFSDLEKNFKVEIKRI